MCACYATRKCTPTQPPLVAACRYFNRAGVDVWAKTFEELKKREQEKAMAPGDDGELHGGMPSLQGRHTLGRTAASGAAADSAGVLQSANAALA